MKKVLTLLVILVLCATGCGGEETAEQAVKNALNAIKMADVEAASKYVDYNKITDAGSDGTLNAEDEKKSEDVAKIIFKNINYKILGSSEEGNAAVVKTEITNLDMGNVMAGFISQVFALAFSGLDEEQLDEKHFEIFTDLINHENKTITKTVDINLSKEDGEWKIIENNDLADALLGGLVTYADNMSSAFGGDKNSDIGKLEEISSWLIENIWNKGFVDIRDYIANGTGNMGQTLDIDFTLEQLDIAMKKKSDYDSFIGGLAGEQYTQIKSIWKRLSPEIDTLYNQVKKTHPIANDVNNSLDTGKFVQYRDAFTDAVYDLD